MHKGVNLLLNLKNLVKGFFSYIEAENIELYNEFSFQHELGIFLRRELEGYTIQFERNVSYFSIYQGRSNQGIYRYFREEYQVYGEIYKPTGATKGKESIVLKGTYNFQWQQLENNKKYFMIEI